MAEEVCEEYRSSLEDLTFNSKPLINVLTMLADDNINHAPQIVQIIEAHLRKVKSEHKLPVMYLIDSIIKNIGKNYLSLFRQNIVSNFCAVFEKGDEKVRMMLFKLRQTWSEVFSAQKLHAIDLRVQQLDPAWPVSPLNRVHVNPKFLENSTNETPKPATPNSAAPTKEENEVLEQLKAKKQELMKIQQQKLQIELMQTQARLEEQTRQLKEMQSVGKEIGPTNRKINQPSSSNLNQSASYQVNTQPPRDPRLSAKNGAARDPRLFAKLSSNNPAQSELPTSKALLAKPRNSVPFESGRFNHSEKTKLKGQISPSKFTSRNSDASESAKKRNASPQKSPTNNKKSKSEKSKEIPKEKRVSEEIRSKEKGGLLNDVIHSRSRSPLSRKDRNKSHGEKSYKKNKELKNFTDVDSGNVNNPASKRVPPFKENSGTSVPVKKVKNESVINELLGSQDKDYRSQMAANSFGTSTKKGWAKYKDEHADEYQSPLQPIKSAPNSIGLGSEDIDLRKQADGNDYLTPQKKFESAVKMTVMVKNQDAILRRAEEQLKLGQMDKNQYDELQASLGKVVKFQDERKKQLRVKDRLKNCGRKIMIDNKMREIRFENGCGIVTMDDHDDHLIYFKGKGRNVIIDGNEIFLNFNGEKKVINIGGQEHVVMFGGPTRELYVDDVPYEGRFGGPPVGVTINGKVFKALLEGPPPDVDVRPLQNRNLSDELNDHYDSNSPVGPNNEEAWDSKSNSDGFNRNDEQEMSRDPLLFDDKDRDDRLMHMSKPTQPPSKSLRSTDYTYRSKWDTSNENPPNDNSNWPSQAKPINPPRQRMQAKIMNDLQSQPRSPPRNFNDRSRFKGSRSGNDSYQNVDRSPKDFYNKVPDTGSNEKFRRHGNFRGNRNRPQNDDRVAKSSYRDDVESKRGFREAPGSRHQGRSRLYPPHQQNSQNMGSNRNVMLNQHGRGNNASSKIPSSHMSQNMQFDQPRFATSKALLPTPNIPSLMDAVSIQTGQEESHPQEIPNLQHPTPQEIPNLQQPPQEKLNLPTSTQPPILAPPTNSANPLINVNISSLFEKLVDTGIINRNETGAGYNIEAKPKTEVVEPVSALVEEKKPSIVKDEDSIPTLELESSSLKKKYPGVIKFLYTGTKCESCGVRFSQENSEKYSRHLDWHFRSNRREKDGAKKANSRKWYYEIEDWIQFEEIEDLEERTQSFFEVQAAEEQGIKTSDTTVYSVPASDDNDKNVCTVCGEEFEHFWDEDEESWHLKDAIRANDKAFHPMCYEDSQKRDGDTNSFLSQTNLLNKLTGILPGLDLIEDEVETKGNVPILDVKIKEEPMDEDEVADTNPLDFSPSAVKQEPAEVKMELGEDEIKESDDSVMDREVPNPEADLVSPKTPDNDDKDIEMPKDDPPTPVSDVDSNCANPQTPLIDENANDPPTPLIDETPTENVDRPEPERVRITPQKGSTISLNLCKATVDSGLHQPAKEKDCSDETPAAPENIEGPEEMLNLPTPDPRFDIQDPVLRGTELSGLCTIL